MTLRAWLFALACVSFSGSQPESHIVASRPSGDPERGRGLYARFECGRCHESEGIEPVPFERSCVRCHAAIVSGELDAPSHLVDTWRESITDLRVTPTLTAIGARLQRRWIESFLREPVDLRPALSATMPRLEMSPEDARDLAAFLVPKRSSEGAPPNAAPDCEALASSGCFGCHAFGELGRKRAASADPNVALAPDLVWTRERFRPDALVTWILDPRRVKPDAIMPSFAMSRARAEGIAACILHGPVTPSPARAVATLARDVQYDEVDRRVLHRTCRHCHAEPGYATGDGGPGNTGGFGFPSRGLDVATQEGLFAGFVDDRGARKSVLFADPGETPRIVIVLLARQLEEAGHRIEGVRGMPLGLPALSPEDVQLVETWLAQGARM